jgi:hypothetical protein
VHESLLPFYTFPFVAFLASLADAALRQMQASLTASCREACFLLGLLEQFSLLSTIAS